MLFSPSGLLVLVSASALASGQQSVYTVPGAFPSSLYSKYYNNPTATSEQPQPVISDPVTVSPMRLHALWKVLIFLPDS